MSFTDTVTRAGEAVATDTGGLTDTSSLGRDEFMRLLVAQLEHQDPLQPMDNTQFVAQLAQFSSLEQLVSVSDGLGLVQMAQMSMSNVQAASLVGRSITASGNGFDYGGTGDAEVGFQLGGDAESVTVNIVDESGARIRTIELGATEGGAASVTWDGMTDSGIAAGPGQYQLEIDAVDADGEAVAVTTQLTGVVTGIFFDHGYAELEVNGSRVPLGDIISIAEADASGEEEGS